MRHEEEYDYLILLTEYKRSISALGLLCYMPIKMINPLKIEKIIYIASNCEFKRIH